MEKNYRKVWIETYGKIPYDSEGYSYEIHHVDGNNENNSLDNLICVSIREHYDIHFKQGDFGACYLIATRMLNKELMTESASLYQKSLIKKNNHNFQKIDKEKRSSISKEVHEKRKQKKLPGFLGIENTVENSRNAGLKAAELKAGFLDTSSPHHGSKAVKNTYWWTCTQTGKRKRSVSQPGKKWKKGMK